MVSLKGKGSSPARRATAAKGQPATYQTRISDLGGMDQSAGDDLLSAYAELYCHV